MFLRKEESLRKSSYLMFVKPVEASQRFPVKPAAQLHTKPPPGTEIHVAPFRHGLFASGQAPPPPPVPPKSRLPSQNKTKSFKNYLWMFHIEDQ